jgi:hypothetical protein
MAITGSVDAMLAEPGGSLRTARPEEVQGEIRIGETRLPFKGGVFVLTDIPPGRHTVQVFGPEGIGAELARTTLIVPERPGPALARIRAGMRGYLGPAAAMPGRIILLTGPFAGAHDEPRLRVAGGETRLRWETEDAACFLLPDPFRADPGEVPVELYRYKSMVASGTMHLIDVSFSFPSPARVSQRGEEIPFGAEVRGLPPPGPREAEKTGLLDLRFINHDPGVVTDLWSKSPRVRREQDQLVVPILPRLVSPEGTAVIAGKMKGKSEGEFTLEGRVTISPGLTEPRRPLQPVGP